MKTSRARAIAWGLIGSLIAAMPAAADIDTVEIAIWSAPNSVPAVYQLAMPAVGADTYGSFDNTSHEYTKSCTITTGRKDCEKALFDAGVLVVLSRPSVTQIDIEMALTKEIGRETIETAAGSIDLLKTRASELESIQTIQGHSSVLLSDANARAIQYTSDGVDEVPSRTEQIKIRFIDSADIGRAPAW